MRCQEFEAVLEQASEQPMPAEVTAHLAQCGNCRSLAADLESITVMARELYVPDEETARPRLDSTSRTTGGEGIIRTPEFQHTEAQHAAGWFAGPLAWMRRPVMVAAYAL